MIAECDNLNIKINYFKSINDFIEKHSSSLDYLTQDWLDEKIDYSVLNDNILDYVNNECTSNISNWLSRSYHYELNGYCYATNANTYNLTDDYVYEMIDGTYLVKVTFESEIEVEFDYLNHMFEPNHYDYTPNHTIGIELGHKYMSIESWATLTVKEKEIVEIQIEDVMVRS